MAIQQSIKITPEIRNYRVGTGKDCKLFINISAEINGQKKYFQIPLTTIVSLQLFTSTDKEPRYTFGSADPRGLTVGYKKVAGHLTAVTFNESLAEKVRKEMKNYQPVDGSKLNLDTAGIIELSELEKLTHLDQLPPCEIKLVYSKSIYGVKFTSSGHSIGGSATMGEQYSFVAVSVSPIKIEKVSNDSEINAANTI